MIDPQPELFALPANSIAAPASRPWRYPDVDAWVRHWLAPMCLTELVRDSSRTWCPKWWAHPIALERLTVVWHQYEHAVQRKDLKADFLHELDYELDTLWGVPGPFMFCQLATADAEGGHEQYAPPALEAAPPSAIGPATATPAPDDDWLQ